MSILKCAGNEEFMSYVNELLETPEVQSLDNFIQHISSTRLDHSLNVAYISYSIAKKFGWDSRSAARGGLLHDLFFYDWRNEDLDESHAAIHPKIALENAKKLCELNEVEEDIILKHMWLATMAMPKYKESFVVTMVDKYCAVTEAFVGLVHFSVNARRKVFGAFKKQRA